MNTKEQILISYYDSKLKMVEIAEQLKISKQYVSKIVKQDTRYSTEKQSRKEISNQKQKERFKKYIDNRRKIEQEENQRLNSFLEMQHNQAACELSGSNSMNNRTIRKWCAGAYNYNNEKKRFEFDNNIGRSYALPKHIKN